LHQTPALIAGALFALAIAVSATLAITLATTGATAADRTGGFLAAIEDVPLMTGLTEEESPALDFDKPDGRLVETYAHGTVDETEAAAFYRAVLPEFGWQAMEGLAFSREGEMLRIEFIPEERSLVVRFVLSPLSSQ
jgi:hypothetical protein